MFPVAFYDTKPYDRIHFVPKSGEHNIDIQYFDSKLGPRTAVMARGCRAVVAFVNDDLGEDTIDALCGAGVEAVAMRCAGVNNVDLRAAAGRLRVFHVPAYSPAAVAEHAMALLLCLNRKLHRAYNRVREYNFSLKGLTGFDLEGKTVGIVGTGKVGMSFARICAGFGMEILAYDPYPVTGAPVTYVDFPTLCARSDVISLHCPLTKESRHLVNRQTLAQMKKGVYIINTSRGALIDAEALLEAIKDERVGGAGLDVYEEESDVFYEDVSGSVIRDDILKLLLSTPNVLVTSHQAFLTEEALENIAEITLLNLQYHFQNRPLQNEVQYRTPATAGR